MAPGDERDGMERLDCEAVRELLPWFVRGTLAADERRAAEAHLTDCPSCRAELYVCRLCRFFDPRVAQQCREPLAEDQRDKTRANFCGYFVPRPDAYRGGGAAVA